LKNQKKEEAGMVNIWEIIQNDDFLIITTNGWINKKGEAVMGRGIALQAKKNFPDLPRILASKIKQEGNKVHYLGRFALFRKKNEILYIHIISFPVKPVREKVQKDCGNIVSHLRKKFYNKSWAPGFAVKAKPDIIARSLQELKNLFLKEKFQKMLEEKSKIYLPLPGTGNGELSKKEVIPLIVKNLKNFLYPDKFFIFSKKEILSLVNLLK